MAALEFAIVAPVLVLMAFSMLDLVLYMRSYYRIERMAGEILNAVAQLDPMTRSGITGILGAAASIGGDNIAITNTTGDDGAIYVTALQGNSNGTANQRLWSVNNYASGSPPTVVSTRLGATSPTLPGGMIVPTGMQYLAVEVLSQRDLRSWGLINWGQLTTSETSQVLYAVTVARPRTANLTGTLPP